MELLLKRLDSFLHSTFLRITQIFLVSPTTDVNRLKKIVKSSQGYIYYVSIKGITGSTIKNISSIKERVKMIKNIPNNRVPVAVGFGIKNKSSARRIASFSDGSSSGTSIVGLMEKYRHNKNIMYKKF